MPALLQSILVAIVGSFLAFLSVFGLNTNEATAPSERPPAIIQEQPKEASTTPQSTPIEEGSETKIDIQAIEPITATLVPDVPSVPTAIEVIPPPAVPAAVTLPPSSISPPTLNELARKSVVNIFCTSTLSGPFDAISASGVIVDSRGIILTNAHVAQYFLLRNYPSPNTMSCVIRTGAPAVATYTAELLFLPKSWVEKNAEKINEEKPLGTGQHDYALLRIVGVTNPQNTLPDSFSALPMTTALPKLNEDVLVVGYPAGFLDGISLQRALYQTSAFTKVAELLTFVENTLDLFSIGGSVVAQSGASGGAATNLQGELMGIVVTSTQAADTASRDLRAITISYFLRDFQIESGQSLTEYVTGDLAEKATAFRINQEPVLVKKLVDALEGN